MKYSYEASISIVLPAYNDAGTIANVIKKAIETAKELADDFEVVVVNDGSWDDTGKIVDDLKGQYGCLKVIHHKRNQGYGGALIEGFSKASNELIFYTDGDGQYDVGELKTLMKNMTDGVDMVNGYKITRSDPVYRIIIGKIYQELMKLLFSLRIQDVDCDFRLFRSKIFNYIELTSKSGVICVEMAKKIQEAGFKIVEVPVHHYPRVHGQSQFFKPRHLSKLLMQLFSVWWNLVILGKFTK